MSWSTVREFLGTNFHSRRGSNIWFSGTSSRPHERDVHHCLSCKVKTTPNLLNLGLQLNEAVYLRNASNQADGLASCGLMDSGGPFQNNQYDEFPLSSLNYFTMKGENPGEYLYCVTPHRRSQETLKLHKSKHTSWLSKNSSWFQKEISTFLGSTLLCKRTSCWPISDTTKTNDESKSHCSAEVLLYLEPTTVTQLKL